MKILVMGTGPFAVPTFRWLLASEHRLLGLVTRPIVDAGRRRKTAANPMRDLAEQQQLKIFDPENVNQAEFIETLGSAGVDLFVVCDFGQILSRSCLAASSKGGINLHGSLLPKYRGAAPVNWAIYHGETTTGVTVIHMSPKLDAGPVLAQRSATIGPNETAAELEPRLAELGVGAVAEAIDLLSDWDGQSSIGQPQDTAQATRAPRLQKGDGWIDWSRPAQDLCNQIRAFQPWPGSYTNWLGESQPRRLILHQARMEEVACTRPPGTVEMAGDGALVVATGSGRLWVETLQPAGKRPMSVAEFLRGRGISPGDRLGNGGSS